VLSLAILAAVSCDSVIQIGPANKPLRAYFREVGSACEVEVAYSNVVYDDERMEPSFYRLPSGATAMSVEVLEDHYCVHVRFPETITLGEALELGSAGGNTAILTVEANPNDAVAPGLVDVRYPPDAALPTVLLTFDDAIDPDSAAETAHYSLAGTIDHPTSASTLACGQSVALVFDHLSTNTSLDIDGLTDVNGVMIEPSAGAPVARDAEEGRPTIDSVAFPADAAAASVAVTFSEAVDRVLAQTVSNYTLGPSGIPPNDARLQPGGTTVLLGFDTLDPPLTLDVVGVVDLNNNPMLPVTAADVTSTDDPNAPRVTLATVTELDVGDGVSVRVAFSEAVIASTAQEPTNYTLRSKTAVVGVTPIRASLLPGSAKLDLVFAYLPSDAMLDVVGVTDLNGNVIADGTTVEIDRESDTVAPRVVCASFVPDAIAPMIDVTFDKAIDETSAVQTGNYTLENGAGPSSAELLTNCRTVRLTTSAIDREDTLTITNVADTSGNVMAPALSLSISAGDDTTAPSVGLVTFASDATSPTIHLEFSEAVDKSTAQTPANYVTSPGSQASLGAVLQDDGRTVVLTFGPIERHTGLNVTNVTDLAGLAIRAATWTVSADDDSNPVSILSASFVANAEAPTVDAVFSEALDKTLAQTTGLYLAGADRITPTSAVVQDNGRTVRLVFPPMEMTDELDVRAITDLSGNQMSPATSVEIEPAQDEDRPFVLSAAFSANASSPTVVVVFNEAVDESSAETALNYRTTNGVSTPVRAVLQTDSRTVQLTFPAINSNNVLVIRDVHDFAGNETDVTKQVPISRDPELTPPTVCSATVTSPTQVTVVFSEAVDKTSAGTAKNYNGYTGGVSTRSAVVQSDGKTVLLTVKGGTVSSQGTIDIANVADLNGNVMVSITGLTLN